MPTSADPTTSTAASRSWTPPDYGNAKAAVDGYLNAMDLYWKAQADPKHVSASTFTKYMTGDAKVLLQGSYEETAKGRDSIQGRQISRVRVTERHLTDRAPWVLLVDCPMQDAADPQTGFHVDASGAVVADRPHDPPYPYAATVKMFLLNGVWTLASFDTDFAKTCSQ